MGQLAKNGVIPHWQAAATQQLLRYSAFMPDLWVSWFQIAGLMRLIQGPDLQQPHAKHEVSCRLPILPFRFPLAHSGTVTDHKRFCEQKRQYCNEFCLKTGYPQIPDFTVSVSWFYLLNGSSIPFHSTPPFLNKPTYSIILSVYCWLISHHVPTNMKWSIMLP